MLYPAEKIDYYKGLISKEIINILNTIQESKLKYAIEYMLLNGGKRLRPLLTIGTTEILEGDITLGIKIGTCIELLHTYSLIHDDLPAMDDDIERRGNPTCHVKFDEATAILAGDGLLNLVFEVISQEKSFTDHQKVNTIKIISSASGCNKMLLGQTMDIEFQDIEYNYNDIIKMHQLKTGALFAACMECGAVLADSNLENSNLLNKFGNNFGSLFQIADDIDDVNNIYEANIINFLGYEKSLKIASEKYNEAKQILNQLNADNNSILIYLLNNLYQKIENSFANK